MILLLDLPEAEIPECDNTYILTSVWSTGQKGTISFEAQAPKSESTVKITFDKDINGIRVKNGKNENCKGEVCTLTYKVRKPSEKVQKLDLLHRLGLESEGSAKMIALEFNGDQICMQKHA